ncbi:ATP-dependent Clp endopeptidase, proteolytic subunit ClpP [Enterococcus sp. AZ194]|uniref:head maturation protease, ClpP-related n=1 Tax=Enterococcus sp. AZ194 TaxID=2774629 RepID=UPI003F1F0D01
MTKIKNVPFLFKNEAKDGKHILTLSGAVRKKYWSDDDAIDAKTIRNTLDSVTDDIVIRLNSPGGDVFEGIEIYNYLKDHSSNITVEVTGTAASAATFIVAGADKVIMNTGTSLMIHEASTWTWGNKHDIQKTLNALETIDGSILSIYAEKTGQSEEQLTNWINEEKWFTAQEAVDYGFADEVKSKKANDDNEGSIEDRVNAQVTKALASFFDSKKEPQPIETKSKSLVARLKKGE